MRIAAIIVAAGRGARAGGTRPKQWQRINGRMIVQHAVEVFRDMPEIGPIVVVVNATDQGYAETLETPGLTVAIGGDNRSTSVFKGLKMLANTDVYKVLIHDAARPCVGPALIRRVIAALGNAPAAAPALGVTDALWTGADGQVTGTQSRDGLYRAQTPQGFDFRAILAAYSLVDTAMADDVEVARRAGMRVAIVPGDEDNLKITHPGDFDRAAKILGMGMDVRVGNGFDVHAFGPGDHVTLCGVRLTHDRGLVGHSDADVGMHALTDAIYGALAEGDIGRHFPPSDPQWKGADSRVFLAHAVGRAQDMGYTIGNVDVTLICEMPKITPHAGTMRARLAEIMQVDMARVSVKATTSERLGFTGRKEGIAAMASATLVRA